MATHKPGFFTASTINPILTGKDDYKLLAGGIQHCHRIALERIGVINEESFTGNLDTEWGNTYEEEAIKHFENKYFLTVNDYQKEIENGWLSCRPDGYIGDNALIEIKCHSVSLNHFNNILSDSFVSEYFNQVQFQLMLSKREKCYLVSYDPRFPENLRMKAVSIYVSHEWQNKCRARINIAEEYINKIIDKLEKMKYQEGVAA